MEVSKWKCEFLEFKECLFGTQASITHQTLISCVLFQADFQWQRLFKEKECVCVLKPLSFFLKSTNIPKGPIKQEGIFGLSKHRTVVIKSEWAHTGIWFSYWYILLTRIYPTR